MVKNMITAMLILCTKKNKITGEVIKCKTNDFILKALNKFGSTPEEFSRFINI